MKADIGSLSGEIKLMYLRKIGITSVLIFSLSMALSKNAYAYLDPGTGSYIIQLLIAAFVGIGFAVRLFWGRIKDFFKKILSKQETN